MKQKNTIHNEKENYQLKVTHIYDIGGRKRTSKPFIITVLYMFKKLDQRLNMSRN